MFNLGRIITPVILVVVFSMSPQTQASNDEREALMRLAYELEALAPLIDLAEDNADKTGRITFRYDWLRFDIERIRAGVLEQATADQATPRQIDPIRGDYRR